MQGMKAEVSAWSTRYERTSSRQFLERDTSVAQVPKRSPGCEHCALARRKGWTLHLRCTESSQSAFMRFHLTCADGLRSDRLVRWTPIFRLVSLRTCGSWATGALRLQRAPTFTQHQAFCRSKDLRGLAKGAGGVGCAVSWQGKVQTCEAKSTACETSRGAVDSFF